MRRTLVLLIALLFPLVLLPGTASADQPVGPAEAWRGFFPEPGQDPESFACEVGPGEEDVVLFSDAATFHGKDLAFPVDDGVGQAFLAHNSWWFRAEHENLETGEGFTVKGHGVFRELSGEQIGTWSEEDGWTAPVGWVPPLDENGDEIDVIGPVYRFTSVEVLHFTVTGDDGRALFRSSARILWVGYYDTLGDGVPGAEFLYEEEPVLLAGTWPFYDFCELALDLAS